MIEQLKKLYNFAVAPVGMIANRKRLQNLIKDLYEENTNIVNKINECIEQINDSDTSSSQEILNELTAVKNDIKTLNDNYDTISSQIQALGQSKLDKTELVNINNKINKKVTSCKTADVENPFRQITSDFDPSNYYQLYALAKLFKNNIRHYYAEKADNLNIERFSDFQELDYCETIFSENNIQEGNNIQDEGRDTIKIDLNDVVDELVDSDGDPIPVIVYIASDVTQGDTIINAENDIGYVGRQQRLDSNHEMHVNFNISDNSVGGYGAIFGAIFVMMFSPSDDNYLEITCPYIGEAHYKEITIFKLPFEYE